MSPTLLLLLLLAQAEGPDVTPEAAPVAAASAEPWHYLARGEATTLALLPRGGAGAREGFLQVEPTLILDGGENWGLKQHLFFGRPRQRGRYTLGLSAVHDWGWAGGRAPGVTLAHVDATAVLVVRPGFELHMVAGGGGRPGGGGAWGAVVGVGADALTPALDLLARLEVRRQHGGFRQGYFGPDHELARFQAAVPEGAPLAEATFPDGFSVYGEAVVGWDAARYGGLQRHLQLSLGAEAFTWGRFDVDGRMAMQLFHRDLEVAVKGLAVGIGQPGARYLGGAEVRWRLFGGRLYALGTGGSLLFPEGVGALRPGAFASVGLGVDSAR